MGCILIVLFLPACMATQKRCLPSELTCRQALSNWQTSINFIVKANFPQDYGRYLAVIWDEEFDNAWVTKGREINITKRFLGKLNPIRRVCVAAHELAHLKMGHYYSRVGIIIVNPDTLEPQNTSAAATPVEHYGYSSQVDIPEGFGINQEVEADRMALKLIQKLGLNIEHYRDLLKLLQGNEVDPDSLIYHRISMMNNIK